VLADLINHVTGELPAVERRNFIKQAGFGTTAVAATALATPALAQANPEIRWRHTSAFPRSLDTLFGGTELFAKIINEMSDGKFQIRIYSAGEIVPALQVYDAVQNGTVECGQDAAYYHFGKDPCFVFETGLPFSLNQRQYYSWLRNGGGHELINDFYRPLGVRSFTFGGTACQMGGWFRKEIKTMADIKGLKFRVGGFAGKVMTRMGAVPQNIPGGEIYQALEKGTIDAAEWVGPYDDLKLGFVKVAPNYAYPGWWEGGPGLELHVNTKAYDSLSPEYKAIIECASTYAHVDMQAKYDGKNAQALKTLVSQGAKLFPFPADMMDAAFKASMDYYSELSAKNANWKRVYDDYAAFRRDSNLWFRFTEATFDNFMQRQRL